MLIVFLVAWPALAAAPYRGAPVIRVIREVEATGVTLIYNDQLVAPDLVVKAEPVATGGLALLSEVLAPHGLVLRRAGTRTWSIVRSARAERQAGVPPPGTPPESGRMDEVVVTTSRYALAQTGAPHVFLTQEELESLPRLADDSLRAVHRLPGAASNGLSGLAHIRGGEENETRIVLDGMPLYEPFHLKNFFSPVSVLDARIIGSLDAYAGGFPVVWGDRMSAVVDTRSVEPPLEVSRELGVSLFHSGGLAAGSFAEDRGRWLVSGRRSNLDEVSDLVNSELGEPRYLDAFAKLGYDFSAGTSAEMHMLVSRDEAEINDSDETEFADARYRNAWLWGTLDHRWSERWSGRSLLGYTTVRNEREGSVREPGRRGSVTDERRYEIATLELELADTGPRRTMRYGLEAAWLDARYAYASDLSLDPGQPFPGDPGRSSVRALAPSPTGWDLGAWVSRRWQPLPGLTAEAGLRWDEQTYDGVDGGTQLSPRANLLYDVSPRSRWRVSWGRFYQAQGINELQVEDGIDRFFPAQRADHFILSYEHGLPRGLELRVEAYYKDYEELKPRFENLFDPLVLLPELQADRIALRPSAGSARGLEFLLNHRTGDAPDWWFSYAWSRAEDDIDTSRVVRSWDQRHTLNAGVNWALGRWDLTLAGTWHSGWPTTPVTLRAVAGDPGIAVDIGSRNSDDLDPFSSVDVRLGYTLPLGQGDLTAYLEITNLLFQRNACCVEYTVRDPDGEASLHRDLDYWPRFVPNLGLLWRF